MNINSVPISSIQTAVWANAIRSLTVDPATDAGAAALVWAKAARTLTAGILSATVNSTGFNSCVNGGSIDFRCAAGKVREITIATQAANSNQMGLWDGANSVLINTGFSSSGPGQMTFIGTISTIGAKITNASGSSVNYIATYVDYTLA